MKKWKNERMKKFSGIISFFHFDFADAKEKLHSFIVQNSLGVFTLIIDYPLSRRVFYDKEGFS